MSAEEVVRTHPAGAALNVWVVPGARRTEFRGLHAGCLRVRVAVPPEGGRANKAVAELLNRELGWKFRLVSGARSRRKRLVALGADVSDLIARLDEILN
jgi:uncharacterized protein YggU (UPF0235/DUF167 family)